MSRDIFEPQDRYDLFLKILTEEIEIDGRKIFLKDDFEKFFIKGNKTAGTRIRKAMQMLRKNAEDVRKDIQDYKKNL